MRRDGTALDRRQFLRQSAALGLGTLFAPALASRASAASKDRIVIYQGVSLDSLHPYGYSGGGITAIWRHIIEPLRDRVRPRRELGDPGLQRGRGDAVTRVEEDRTR